MTPPKKLRRQQLEIEVTALPNGKMDAKKQKQEGHQTT
jgi:hypothetical protein